MFPNRAPKERDSHLQSLPYIFFRVPSKEAPLQVPLTQLSQRETLHFQSPPSTISLIPSTQNPPPRFPYLLTNNHSLEVPGKETPSMFTQQGPYRHRCPISRAKSLFIHLNLSESPVKKNSHETSRKTYSQRPRSLTRTECLHQWGAAWFPKWIIYNTAITTPVPCSLQHDTFHFVFGRPEPRQTACVIVTLNRVSPPHLLPPPTCPRV